MLNLTELLSAENREQQDRIAAVQNLYRQIVSSYEFHPNVRMKHYVSNEREWATIYFNGNTRLNICGDRLILTGFGLREHPKAVLSKVPGCGDEGSITGDLKEIVNALATYENIYPKK